MSDTDLDMAKRSAHQLWALMELLQRVGLPMSGMTPALGAPATPDGKLDPSKPYLALQITVEGVPPFSVNAGALLVPMKTFEKAWEQWVLSIRGAQSETDVEKKNREEVCWGLLYASDAWNEREGLYNYLENMGCKITRHDEASIRG